MAGASSIFFGDERAIKATHIPVDFDAYLNGLQERASGLTAWSSPWYQAVIRKRANGAVAIPRRVMRGETEIEEAEFDGQMGGPRIDLPRLIEQASIAVDNVGAAYFAAVQNSGKKVLEVRWLDPRTIKIENDKVTGQLIKFNRVLNGQVVQSYTYDKKTRKAPGLAWVWSVGMNEMGPGDTLSEACKLPAGTLVMGDALLNGLYGRGAINQHWVTASYNPPEAEKERLATKIRRALFGGVDNAHGVEVFNEGLVVTKIGTDPNALELGPTADRLQNDICAVCDTPRILLNTVDASNRATIDRITQTWLQSTIKPHAQAIIDALNFHVLEEMGYTIELNTAGMDVDQQEEAEKAQAWAVYVDHDVDAETAAAMLGIDIPEGMQFIDEAKVAQRQADNEARMAALQAGQQQQGQPSPNGKEPDTRREKEVKALGLHIESGAYLAHPFKSDILTPADIEAAIIAAEWRGYP
jgi:hypothetical protein